MPPAGTSLKRGEAIDWQRLIGSTDERTTPPKP
jgi:hypothetical protein